MTATFDRSPIIAPAEAADSATDAPPAPVSGPPGRKDQEIWTVFESITDAVFVLDRTWRFTFLNSRAVQLISSGRNLTGQDIWAAFPEAIGSSFYQAYHEAFATGRTTSCDQFYPPLDRWFEARAYPSEHALTVYFRDITEERALQRRLEESEGLLRSLFEAQSLLAGILELVPDQRGPGSPGLRLVTGNRALLTLLGHPSADLPLCLSASRIPAAQLSILIPRLQQIVAGGRAETLEVPRDPDHPEGSWYEVTLAPITAEPGRPQRLSVIAADITERRQAESARQHLLDELDLERRRFRTMVETIPAGVILAEGKTGAVSFANARANDLLQQAMGEVTGFEGYRRFTARTLDDRPVTHRDWPLVRALAGEVVGGEEFLFTLPDGSERWLRVAAEPVRDAQGAVTSALAVLYDVDMERRNALALAESARRLELATRVAGLGVFEWIGEGDRIIWESAQLYDIFGRDRALGPPSPRHWIESIIDPRDRARFVTQLAGRDGRGEMDITVRIHRESDAAERFIRIGGQFLPGPEGGWQRLVGVVGDVTEALHAEERRRLLVNELNHRVKNTLGTVASIARQSFRHSDPAALSTFEARLQALAQVHDVLTREDWKGAGLLDLVQTALLPFRRPVEDPFLISGPPVRVSPRFTLSLSLALHELATNAVKYGALSVLSGRIRLTWSIAGGTVLTVVWQEQGGPPVRPPARRGFGSRLIEVGLSREVQGAVALEFAPDGVRCTIEAPLDQDGVEP